MPDSDNSTPNSSSYDHHDDPLYLCSTDQPYLKIVTKEFDGSNFHLWQRDVLMALTAKNKDVFLDGRCRLPSVGDKKYSQWLRCDLMVRKWILNSINSSISEDLMFANTSKQLWTELTERYGMPNSLELYRLRKNLGATVQENTSLVEYYSKLKRTWEDIEALDPLPDCSCGALKTCTCQLLKRLLDRETHTKLIHLLMGLNASYEHIKTNVLNMEPMPPITKVLGMLQRVERQKQISDSIDHLGEATAYAVDTQSYNMKPSYEHALKKPRLVRDDRVVKECTHCNKRGHSKAECFKLQDCSYCGMFGHVKEQCYKLKNLTPGRGRGRSHYRGNGSRNYKHTANHVDMIQSEHDDDNYDLNDPLDEEFHGTGNHNRVLDHTSASQAYANAFGNQLAPEVVNGIVNNVMQQVMKAFSDTNGMQPDNTMKSANFAGPFK